MHIRTFRAANLQAALADIREQMGPEASVLHTRQIRAGLMGWLGRTHVEVTAGLRDAKDPPAVQSNGFGTLMPQDARSTLGKPSSGYSATSPVGHDPLEAHPLESVLRDAGVSQAVRSRWISSAVSFAANMNDSEAASAKNQLEHLQRAVARELNLCGPIRTQPGDRHVVALVGPTGVGKTTTVAKLAAGFRIEAKRRVGLLTIDTYRIAAVQQLQAYAEIMDLPMQVVEQPDQMKPALDALGDVDLVLIDTAGRSPRSDARIEQLSQFLREAQPDETHLVLSATSSADNITAMLKGFAPVAATAVILTKLDETPNTAGVLSALTASERHQATPLSYVTIGQQVPDDIAVADAPHLVAPLLPVMPSSIDIDDGMHELGHEEGAGFEGGFRFREAA